MKSLKTTGILKSLVLKSLAVLMITSLVACKSMHTAKRIDKNEKTGKNGKPTDGRNQKPIAQRGANASGYLYLTGTIARNSLRLITIAVEGSESKELLDCQKLTSKNTSGNETQYTIVSSNCDVALEGEETFIVTRNDKKEITKITSENTRGIKLRKINKSPSQSSEVLSEMLIAKLTIERTEVGIFNVTTEANLDYVILGNRAKESDNHALDVKLTGVLNLTDAKKVLFDLNESSVDHVIKKNGKLISHIETEITRNGNGATDAMEMTCGIANSEYQVKQQIDLNNKKITATVQLTAAKGVILNPVTKSKFKPTRMCDQNYLQIADALRSVSFLERGIAAFNGPSRDSRGNSTKSKKSSTKKDDKKTDSKKEDTTKKDDKNSGKTLPSGKKSLAAALEEQKNTKK